MTKLVLRMAPESIESVLAGVTPWPEDNPFFTVVCDSSLPLHHVVYATEAGHAQNPDATDHLMDFSGLPISLPDLIDMHEYLSGRNPFCERYPYACERLP
jgi:hypothetical protein